MNKTVLIYITVAIAVAGAAGGTYYLTQEARTVETPTAVESAPIVVPAQPSNTNEVRRKTLEGIGSIKDLKPVPLQPSQR